MKPPGKTIDIDIAVHLRTPEISQIDSFPNRLLAEYSNGQSAEIVHLVENITVNRLYIGDEFCVNRLPTLKELEPLSAMIEARRQDVTLLLPVLSDIGIENYSKVLRCFSRRYPEAEVVVNDWGVFFYLRQHHPRFKLSLGRLLNKGFKDPRLPDAHRFSDYSHEATELLNTGTFDQPMFQKQMKKLGIHRFERDMPPYGVFPDHRPFPTTVYFPYGYITSARNCWTAALEQPPEQKFVPAAPCSGTCRNGKIELENPVLIFKTYYCGNTVFFRYSPEIIKRLLKKAHHYNYRLVYQGFAI